MKNRFEPKLNIKKGDDVVVIAGNDKDRTKARKVLAVYPSQSRVLVEGVNVRTKHQKPDAQKPQGGIVEQEAPIHISNVMLWDAKSKGPSRIKRERKDDGSYVRISKKSGEVIK
ncbi:MAG: 50S ribosomal protein L24 [Chitinophagales bacterium]|nr:50S ribosomal protein L24 [Chitinophagales bacterium]